MTNIIYGKELYIKEKYSEVRQKYFGIASDGFDIVSSQFSMHYYFESRKSFDGFIRNLRKMLKRGYFIGTCYDGKKIFDYFKKIDDERIAMVKQLEESSEEETSEEKHPMKMFL